MSGGPLRPVPFQGLCQPVGEPYHVRAPWPRVRRSSLPPPETAAKPSGVGYPFALRSTCAAHSR
eukprot:7479149-Lingulodinium_polyedra.AAC.1